jgi:hypothetical protein
MMMVRLILEGLHRKELGEVRFANGFVLDSSGW